MSNSGPESLIPFLEAVFTVCKNNLSRYTHKKSRKDYLWAQKVAIALFARKLNITYREALALIGDSRVYRQVLDLTYLPAASSISRAWQSLNTAQMQVVLAKTAHHGRTCILDSTHMHSTHTTPYYYCTHASGRRTHCLKAHVVFSPDTSSVCQAIITHGQVHDVRPGPGPCYSIHGPYTGR